MPVQKSQVFLTSSMLYVFLVASISKQMEKKHGEEYNGD